ncbi:riboflavin kinase [Lysinibacillus sp. BW-2-10]|uniref:riboflavin kinase n=1 Tax=Lysinibacillus sp. BW-2-10 TaxID=2590030 RepID=UPI00117C6D79|nr:riboflavin kinase [Lysinibacillus sp. BW-2-10]TSI02296.1 riboflavin kinase [Lysinibacillus sp. BW-2-10]
MKITLQKGIRFMSGRVDKGKQVGRTLGFPTANLTISLGFLPTQGVYGVYVYRGFRQYLGVMNIGNRPTFQDGVHQTIEVYLLDFDECIYGETLIIEVLFPIREERKFSSLAKLISQLQKDVDFARAAFHEISTRNVAM